ncbi:arginine-tRNA-protein transferase domain protein [Candidatus Moduliflexus flocculans]|uniref:Aspartate/glutamate leucyltransferase n=1 Tax=Candidatus Moduliflexus flocculans TaxID=1499966 RepID=A0A0S6W4Q7_9BACT|nr:arginine-tRNA-protein transferase domain protein [Candidatus Moduliflexus flocculans]
MSQQTFFLYQSFPMDCPYLDNQVWVFRGFDADTIEPAQYDELLSRGFRRSGTTVYHQHCPNCRACLPLRIDARRFAPTTSQRRVLRKNQDVRYTRTRAAFAGEDFALYRRYVDARHPSDHSPDADSYREFLINSPVTSELMRYYVADRLIGIGWIDMQPDSISSVYCAFDPDESDRSPGTFSILQQVALARSLGKAWVYLGFWVEQSRKMSYKNKFHPCQILRNGRWQVLR